MSAKMSARKNPRLPGYDYSQAGAYFVTICTKNRKWFLGEIRKGVMRPSKAGKMVLSVWQKLPDRFPNMSIDEHIVMPNHLHGVVIIGDNQDDASAASLGAMVRAFKALTASKIRSDGEADFGWQRNYFEHVVREERSSNRIREYIQTNPLRWHLDRENPESTGGDEFDAWLESFTQRPDIGTEAGKEKRAR